MPANAIKTKSGGVLAQKEKNKAKIEENAIKTKSESVFEQKEERHVKIETGESQRI